MFFFCFEKFFLYIQYTCCNQFSTVYPPQDTAGNIRHRHRNIPAFADAERYLYLCHLMHILLHFLKKYRTGFISVSGRCVVLMGNK